MEIFELYKTKSIANNFLRELRDIAIQKDRLRFRKNIERLGQILAYEISKNLAFTTTEITTPLSLYKTEVLNEQIVIATILRAGLPFYNGFLSYFDNADSAFIGAMRVESNISENIEIELNYHASPNLENRTLILCDPMLATGKSLVKSYFALVNKKGLPSKTYISAVIASRIGIEYIIKNIPNCAIYVGVIDVELNDQQYIVPGLGDAGDLCFGKK